MESPVPLSFLIVPVRVEFRFLLATASPVTPTSLVASAFALLRDPMSEEELTAAMANGHGYLDAFVIDIR